MSSEPPSEKKLKRSHSEDLVTANREKIKKIEEWRRLKQAIYKFLFYKVNTFRCVMKLQIVVKPRMALKALLHHA